MTSKISYRNPFPLGKLVKFFAEIDVSMPTVSTTHPVPAVIYGQMCGHSFDQVMSRHLSETEVLSVAEFVVKVPWVTTFYFGGKKIYQEEGNGWEVVSSVSGIRFRKRDPYLFESFLFSREDVAAAVEQPELEQVGNVAYIDNVLVIESSPMGLYKDFRKALLLDWPDYKPAQNKVHNIFKLKREINFIAKIDSAEKWELDSKYPPIDFVYGELPKEIFDNEKYEYLINSQHKCDMKLKLILLYVTAVLRDGSQLTSKEIGDFWYLYMHGRFNEISLDYSTPYTKSEPFSYNHILSAVLNPGEVFGETTVFIDDILVIAPNPLKFYINHVKSLCNWDALSLFDVFKFFEN